MNLRPGAHYQRTDQDVLPPARFVMLPKKNKPESLKVGRDVFTDREYIEIMKQGGAILTFEVNEEHKRNYPAQYEAFKRGQEAPRTGTPLENWPGCSRAECENLKSINLFTIEDLAGATDATIQGYGMGGRALQKKAIEYLDGAKDVTSLVNQVADLTKKLENAHAAIADLQAAQAKSTEKKRGRPPKS